MIAVVALPNYFSRLLLFAAMLLTGWCVWVDDTSACCCSKRYECLMISRQCLSTSSLRLVSSQRLCASAVDIWHTHTHTHTHTHQSTLNTLQLHFPHMP